MTIASLSRGAITAVSVVGVAVGALVLGTVAARAGGVSFVADASQAHAGGDAQQGRMFVSPAGVRFETGAGERQVVQIVLPKQKLTRVLIPSEKIYFEYSGAAPLPMDRPSTPCTSSATFECHKVGDEKIGAAMAEKWTARPKGAPAAMTIWWAPKRKMVLRQNYPDGRVVQMVLTGMDTYEGRPVERWETSYRLPNGQAQKAVQLFDVKLELAVRETQPNGTTRSLSNIREMAADPAWFAVPDGYSKIDAPAPQTGAGNAERTAPVPGRAR